ncbi:uncharacterized protein J3D65DRAFT_698238 [Phyllosticta citribraziliensis]|uniref:Secreted protein n=1 Tax=Phyllosticta citribraziliensis TaxID=989973 RepID=A0ABR1LLS9_9PEZI
MPLATLICSLALVRWSLVEVASMTNVNQQSKPTNAPLSFTSCRVCHDFCHQAWTACARGKIPNHPMRRSILSKRLSWYKALRTKQARKRKTTPAQPGEMDTQIRVEPQPLALPFKSALSQRIFSIVSLPNSTCAGTRHPFQPSLPPVRQGHPICSGAGAILRSSFLRRCIAIAFSIRAVRSSTVASCASVASMWSKSSLSAVRLPMPWKTPAHLDAVFSASVAASHSVVEDEEGRSCLLLLLDLTGLWAWTSYFSDFVVSFRRFLSLSLSGWPSSSSSSVEEPRSVSPSDNSTKS